MGGATGPRSPGERSPVCFVDAGACASGEDAGACATGEAAGEQVQHCFAAVRVGSVFGTGVRFVDASARRDSETMIYITFALATCRAASAALELLGEQ